jgi:UDP-N-acetylmuramoyl-L-alanyl-D-glutamate--2,6-diaminopimelate ligase
MKILRDILFRVSILEVVGSTNLAIEGLASDSRRIGKNSLFFACRGTLVDGHDFIELAIELGAVGIVCEALPDKLHPHITYIRVGNVSGSMGWVAANFHGNPSSKLKTIGVTGTNGKTSVATGLYDLFSKMGFACGLLSTVENRIGAEVYPATHTTPDAIQLQSLLQKMLEKGIGYCFMEVSSHALDQNRTTGVAFSGAIFTNITQDHLDYHKTFSRYIEAKKKLFDGLSSDAWALVNGDDRNGRVMLQNCKGSPLYTYGLRGDEDIKGKIVENSLDGLLLQIQQKEISTPFVGKFNASNLLAIYGAAVLLKQNSDAVLTHLSLITPPPGRFQRLSKEGCPTVFVDYAHTPDALEKVLITLQETTQGQGHIITVVGCGGNRDAAKRSVMGKIATQYSQKSIFTSDNPRNEEPMAIMQAMLLDLSLEEKVSVLMIESRSEAIKAAFHLAMPQDVILIAGKGHETYQEILGIKHPFDDVLEVRNALNEYNA